MDGLSISGVKLLTLLFKSFKKKIPYSMKNWQLLSQSHLNVRQYLYWSITKKLLILLVSMVIKK